MAPARAEVASLQERLRGRRRRVAQGEAPGVLDLREGGIVAAWAMALSRSTLISATCCAAPLRVVETKGLLRSSCTSSSCTCASSGVHAMGTRRPSSRDGEQRQCGTANVTTPFEKDGLEYRNVKKNLKHGMFVDE